MRLSKKTFCYSIIISLVLVVFIVLYFTFMLPSLYVKYVEKDNLNSAADLQTGYIKGRSYEGLVVKNPTGAATVEIPMQGDEIYLTGKAFHIEIKIKEGILLDTVDQFRESIAQAEDDTEVTFPKIDIEKLKKELVPGAVGYEDYPVSFDFTVDQELEGLTTSKIKTHMVSDEIVIFEGGMTDGDNQYTTYIAFTKTEDAVIFTVLPVTTPQMKEIRPIVLGSMPMIAAVVLLLVLIGSWIFSRRIVNPVIRLADYAEEVKTAGSREVLPLRIKEKDEIGELGSTLNELYARLHQQYRELEEKNRELARENKRQEVFLRASSHQLKTPIAAAILLVDGMIQEVGKYKDTKAYLPQVKKQLKSIQKIVEDILYLNRCTEHIRWEEADISALIEEVLGNYEIQIQQKELTVLCLGHMGTIVTDREILKKVVDNLVSNAVSYTPQGQKIEIRCGGQSLEIVNHGAGIEEELLPHIYEPFVSSSTGQRGRGLGLYVASYYADILGFQIEVKNIDGGVCAALIMQKEHKGSKRQEGSDDAFKN